MDNWLKELIKKALKRKVQDKHVKRIKEGNFTGKDIKKTLRENK